MDRFDWIENWDSVGKNSRQEVQLTSENVFLLTAKLYAIKFALGNYRLSDTSPNGMLGQLISMQPFACEINNAVYPKKIAADYLKHLTGHDFGDDNHQEVLNHLIHSAEKAYQTLAKAKGNNETPKQTNWDLPPLNVDDRERMRNIMLGFIVCAAVITAGLMGGMLYGHFADKSMVHVLCLVGCMMSMMLSAIGVYNIGNYVDEAAEHAEYNIALLSSESHTATVLKFTNSLNQTKLFQDNANFIAKGVTARYTLATP